MVRGGKIERESVTESEEIASRQSSKRPSTKVKRPTNETPSGCRITLRSMQARKKRKETQTEGRDKRWKQQQAEKWK